MPWLSASLLRIYYVTNGPLLGLYHCGGLHENAFHRRIGNGIIGGVAFLE